MLSMIDTDSEVVRTQKISYKTSHGKVFRPFYESYKSMLCMIRWVLFLPIFIEDLRHVLTSEIHRNKG